MAIDRVMVGELTAQLIDNLEETFGEDENAEIAQVMMIVSVKHRVEGEVDNTVRWINSPGMAIHEALGLLRYVQLQAEAFMFVQPDSDEGEDEEQT